jgi:hypothetical protein
MAWRVIIKYMEMLTYSDAAKRIADAMTLHSVHGGKTGSWLAFSLSDGYSDGVLYDSRNAAVDHQLHESLCLYVQLVPGGMQPREAEELLKAYRHIYDAGFRVHGPEDHTPAIPIRNEAVVNMLRNLK